MTWIEIGFWLCLSVLSTLICCWLQADASFRAGYRRGYKDGEYKIRPPEPKP